jgi:hypothetical protein
MKMHYLFQSSNLKYCLGVKSTFVILFSIQNVRAFQLSVNLFDVKSDTGKLGVSVTSTATDKEKSLTAGEGRYSGSTITGISFKSSDKDLQPNGGFVACVHSYDLNKSQCEQADRHYDTGSAVIWIQVTGS